MQLQVSFSLGLTLLSAIVIIFVGPAAQSIELGSGKVVDWIEDFLEDTLQMLTRGCSVIVMVLWYYTAYSYVHLGKQPPLPTALPPFLAIPVCDFRRLPVYFWLGPTIFFHF